MEQTSLEELKRTAASGAYRRIPIWREIFSDIATPVQVLKKLLAVSDHCFLLESAEDNKQWGRYSFLGFDPAMELTCMNHQVTITTDHIEQFETENPAQVIARVIEENRAADQKASASDRRSGWIFCIRLYQICGADASAGRRGSGKVPGRRSDAV